MPERYQFGQERRIFSIGFSLGFIVGLACALGIFSILFHSIH
jgi:hypothetical protein